MRKQFIHYLCCPEAGTSFDCAVFEADGPHIVSGLLKTKSTWYPVIAGIPRILVGELKVNSLQVHHAFLQRYSSRLPAKVRREWRSAIAKLPDLNRFLRHQKKTADRFGFEWKHIYKENDYERENFYHFLAPFMDEKDLNGKTTLDVGCGSGRFTKWAALAKTTVSFGTDLGNAVEVAYAMTKHLPNVAIVQADIYDMPFNNQFDLAFSIGVLHHLPQPKEAFCRLLSVLKSGGRMLIWVYNRRGNNRAIYLYEPLRSVLKHLPSRVLLGISYLPGLAVHAINGVTKMIAATGAKRLAQKMPFSYYINFPFNMKLNDSFDVLATPKSNYYYKEDVEEWFNDAGLKKVKSFEHLEAGISVIGSSP